MVSMKRIATIVIVLLAQTIVACGQQTNTIYKTLFTGITTTTTTSAITNIGQSNHQVYIHFSSQTGHVCSSPAASGELQFSYDSVTWKVFGSPTAAGTQTDPSSALDFLWFGSGAFPFVRFKLTAFDTTNCQADGYYSGILGGALFTQVAGTARIGQTMTGGIYPIVMGGLSGHLDTGGNTLSNVANPATVCLNNVTLDSVAAGTRELFVSPLNVAHVRVCSITFNTDTDGATVKVFTMNSGCGTPVTTLIPTMILSKNTLHTIGSSLGAAFITGDVPTGASPCITTVGGNFSVLVNYAIVSSQ